MDGSSWHGTGGRDQDHPQGKKNDINWLGLIDNILQANVALNYGMKQGKD